MIFAQPLGNGVIRRGATVSQSPQMIQQWVQDKTAPHGGEPNWEAVPAADARPRYPRRRRVDETAREYLPSDVLNTVIRRFLLDVFERFQ